jgi:type VI secretion system protein ImpL
VILADRGAVAAARGGVGVATLRRALLGGGLAAALVRQRWSARSWAGNRDLVQRTVAAARAVVALPAVREGSATAGMPSLEALRQLDALRTLLDTVRGHQAAGVPLRLGMGLWQGDAILASGSRAWLAGYRRQLHDRAWAASGRLAARPARRRPPGRRLWTRVRPAEDLPDRHDRAGAQHARPVAPVLLDAWRGTRPVDGEALVVARRQFEFFARSSRAARRGRSRAMRRWFAGPAASLGQFAGAERIYQAMIAEASTAAPPARLTDLAPQAPGVVSTPGEMPGAFTDRGWTRMQTAFGDADRYFTGEQWVMGAATAAQAQGSRSRARGAAGAVPKRVRATLAVVGARPQRRAGLSAHDAACRSSACSAAPVAAARGARARGAPTAIDSTMAAAFQPVHHGDAAQGRAVRRREQPAYAGALLHAAERRGAGGQPAGRPGDSIGRAADAPRRDSRD